MPEIIAGLLADAAFRLFVEELTLKAVAQVFHRRASDPNYLALSDSIFVQLANAKTDEEQLNAQKALKSLLASS